MSRAPRVLGGNFTGPELNDGGASLLAEPQFSSGVAARVKFRSWARVISTQVRPDGLPFTVRP
jgi:hypothetical protein